MKKFITLFALLIPCLSWASSSTSNDTTLLIGPNKYVIKDSAEFINVEIFNEKGDQLTRVYESKFENGTKKTRWQINEIFNFPFQEEITGKKKHTHNCNEFNPHWAGVGFGFNNVTNNKMNFIHNNAPDGVNLNFGQSFEIFWNICDVGIPIKNNLGLVFGFGLDWRNYVMDENKRFADHDYRIIVEPIQSGANLKYSRLKTLDITLPIMLEWQKQTSKKELYIMGGAQVNFRTHSSMKTEFSYNGAKHEVYQHGINSNPVNVDLMVQTGYGMVGFYVKQSLFNIFPEGKGPEMKSFSTGVVLNF